jgi:CBS domain-containing protein
MWWPPIGGLVVGIGGLFQPHALGVGYDTIAELLRGEMVPQALLSLILVKGVIWAIALGSGTSGGVLAPLLILGSALGALESLVLPGGSPALWPLVSMAAVLSGTMRSPFTSVIFAFELTQDVNALLPCLVASIVAYGFTVLVMKRSILTEKVARRGFHLSREYSVDPLELTRVKDVMSRDVVVLPQSLPVTRVLSGFFAEGKGRKHQGYPVVDDHGALVGIVTRSNLLEPAVTEAKEVLVVADILEREVITASGEESCRSAVEKMAQAHVGRLPVVAADHPRQLIGIITRSDLLQPHARNADEEQRRERFVDLRLTTGRGSQLFRRLVRQRPNQDS